MQFSLVEMWNHMGIPARMVVFILIGMSIYFLAVAIERFITFTRARSRSLEFVLKLRDHLRGRDIKKALATAKEPPGSPIARLVAAALEEHQEGVEALAKRGPHDIGDFDIVDAVNRALDRVKEREIADLRRGLSGLATVASSAPFVGLFGTVLGIITCFQKLTEGGGLNTVAPGIAEALITTALGIGVAIVAVVAFNFFTNRVDDFLVDMNDVSAELISVVLKEGRDSPVAASAAASGAASGAIGKK